MTTPNIDTNSWYSLYIAGDKNSLLMGTNLFSRSGTAGAAFFVKSAPDNSTQRWQIYPVNDTSFVLRTQEGGANAFIGSQPADEKGVISPLMLRGDVADDSVFWNFGNWGDGTWYLSNGGNGTAYHLARNGTGIVMDRNISAPQNKQRWAFDGGAKIDDPAYSSVNLLGATLAVPLTSTSSSTIATTSSPPSSSTSAPATSSTNTSFTGLSTPAKAGLGAALGIAALIALVVLGLFFRRRRTQKRTSTAKDLAYEPYHVTPPALPDRRPEFVKHELDHDSASAKYEMPQHSVVEVDARGQERPAELMGDVERR